MNKIRKSKRINKKAIPLHFQKGHTSLSQLLTTGSHKRRIRELQKNNKQLALAVQDARLKVAFQEKRLDEYSKDRTKMQYARIKVKEMAETITKLVADLDEVMNCLDAKSPVKLQNRFSQDFRLQLKVPDVSAIDESVSKSTIEADTTEREDLSVLEQAETNCVPCQKNLSPAMKDNSTTEIYNSQPTVARTSTVLKGSLPKAESDDATRKSSVGQSAAIPVQSPPTPQLEISHPFNPPAEFMKAIQAFTEAQRKPLQSINRLPFSRGGISTFASKIPKTISIPPPIILNENKEPVTELSNIANRRETFVIQKTGLVQENSPVTGPTAADRRGTFTIKDLELNDQYQNDRRATYVVPVNPVHGTKEKLQLTNNIVETTPPFEKAMSNKTVFLYEDMELTDIIPICKLASNEEIKVPEKIPTHINKEPTEIAPIPCEDMEITEVVPILKLTLSKKDLPKDSVVRGCQVTASTEENSCSDKNSFLQSDDCFVKPDVPKQTTVSVPGTSNKRVSLKVKKVQDSVKGSSLAKDDETVTSKRSLAKVKPVEIEPDTVVSKVSLKGKASNITRKKSLAPKKSGKFSNPRAEKTPRESKTRASLNKPLSPKHSDIIGCLGADDIVSSDTIQVNSSPPRQRPVRSKSSLNFAKFFDDSSPDFVRDKDFFPGRRVINFLEGRKSLVPKKKRDYVFKNSTKQPAAENLIPNDETLKNSEVISSDEPNEGQDVFTFSESSESSASNSTVKPKKSKKSSKRSNATVQSQNKNAHSNKKPRSEKVPQQETEECGNTDIICDEKKTVRSPIKLSTAPRLASTESSDDSFVIGDNLTKNLSAIQSTNLKGNQAFFEIPKRNGSASSKSGAETPPSVQASPKDILPSMEDTSTKKSCLANIEICDLSPPRSSNESRGRKKTKRTFSGVSERRSKRSTLNNPDFLDELDLNNAFTLDCENTEVYLFKDKVNCKTRESDCDQENVPTLTVTKGLGDLHVSNAFSLRYKEVKINKIPIKNNKIDTPKSSSTQNVPEEEKINSEVVSEKQRTQLDKIANDVLCNQDPSSSNTLKTKQTLVNKGSKPNLKKKGYKHIPLDDLMGNDIMPSKPKTLNEKPDIQCEIDLVPTTKVNTKSKPKKSQKKNLISNELESVPTELLDNILKEADTNAVPTVLDSLPTNEVNIKSQPKKSQKKNLISNELESVPTELLDNILKEADTNAVPTVLDSLPTNEVNIKSEPKKSRKKKLTSSELEPVPTELLTNTCKEAATNGVLTVFDPLSTQQLNRSGSIDSLCNYNAASDYPGSRQPRRTRTTKSLKEPKLNAKMRRH